jgi:radical SAM protein with 4Fe4S-binding SPASM domain
MPSREKYASFLVKYLKAARKNPTLSLKDNLFNIILYKNSLPLFEGCVGFGCSPAFNTVAVLSDGEVHACRKFPSLIGNINKKSLSQIYDSRIARKYRKGNCACAKCYIKPLCGGCMASIKSHGLDIFKDKDPYCFIDELS